MSRSPSSTDGGMPAIAPMPVAAGARRVLLFGGTFDPVHRGHLGAAAAARTLVMGNDGWLVFVPAARSPFKGAAPGAGNAERVEMLELALHGVERTGVWKDELGRAAPSYWVDTVKRARALLGGGTDLRFLIGADAATAIHRWKDWRAILEVAEPVVMARPPITTAAKLGEAMAAAGGWGVAEVEWWRERFVAGAVIDVSATEVRAALRSADPRLRELLHPAVADFIRRRGLYQ